MGELKLSLAPQRSPAVVAWRSTAVVLLLATDSTTSMIQVLHKSESQAFHQHIKQKEYLFSRVEPASYFVHSNIALVRLAKSSICSGL